ncbi:GNAT family N-acetyltransferase [Natronoglycomyces albus]|uniref:GNAT family N-acetyltransferase n=1 Tax=Natronoglycomyces albus TaxID=2811108 RepID=A0A895XT96_9ACTN|nr:GNAT family protein [Natronoglycomyces albus]QSB06872.1 GNAT family N-acetyltransferase [Natronoglycomyces albus]
MSHWAPILSTGMEDERIRLEPLTQDHRKPLRDIAIDERIWEFFVSRVTDEAEFTTFFDNLMEDQRTGRCAVYAIVEKETGTVCGSSAFGNLDAANDRLEIGWSWLGIAFQGSGINRHAKRLLLRRAFEELGCQRVEFKTDVLNQRARAALRKIGATEEGVLRSYNYMPSGRRRDAIYYSVLAQEWPTVKDAL